MNAKVYEFNSADDKPIVNLACANGFLPQTYTRALQPLFNNYHVISIFTRPMWDNCPPESLQSWSQLGDDLLEGLGTLTDQPIVGIGHSVGAIMAMYAAIKEPKRFSQLVLIDPTLLPSRILWIIRMMRLLGRGVRLPLVQGALRRRRTWDTTDEAYAYFRGKPLFTRAPDDIVRTYTESITAPGNDGKVHLTFSPEWEARLYETIDTSVWKLPARLTHPTLIIRGSVSDTFTQDSENAFRKRNPRVRIVTLENVGHLVPQEQPDQTGKLIAEFLA